MMGMVCCFASISDESINVVRKHPVLLMKYFLEDEEFVEYAEEYKNKKQGLLSRLFGSRKVSAEELLRFETGENEKIQTDIDKAWHGIHFMLTGSVDEGDEPLNFIAFGGDFVDCPDFGYNTSRMHTSKQVKQIDRALQAISKKILRAGTILIR